MSPTGKNPKLGEQIVPPPAAPVVQDPAPATVPTTSPSGLSTDPAPDENLTLPTPAPPVVADGVPLAADEVPPADGVLPVAEPEPVPELTEEEKKATIRLEGTGVRVPLADLRDYRQFRVAGTNGLYYEHVSQAPDGEWEYRQVN